MGPVFGILIVDYYLIRRRHTEVPDLYSEAPQGTYHYTRGFNPRALTALAITGTAGVLIALIPHSQHITALSWPVGVVLGGGLMYALNAGRRSVAG